MSADPIARAMSPDEIAHARSWMSGDLPSAVASDCALAALPRLLSIAEQHAAQSEEIALLRESEDYFRRDAIAECARAEAAEQALGELLAVIHRDGGHRQAQHGVKQAVDDAHRVIAAERAHADALAEALAEYVGAERDRWNARGLSIDDAADNLAITHLEGVVRFRTARAALAKHAEGRRHAGIREAGNV